MVGDERAEDRTQFDDAMPVTTGYARKYAIRLLAQTAPPTVGPIHRPRPHRYGRAVAEALTTAWAAANYVCAKRLVPFLPGARAALAVELCHLAGVIATTQDGACRHRTFDACLLVRRQPDLKCAKRFAQLITTAGPDQRYDCLVLRQHPGNGQLGHAHSLARCDGPQGLDQRQILLDVLPAEARRVRAEIAGVAGPIRRPMAAQQTARDSPFSIVAQYQAEYRGLVAYYQMADNVSRLNRLKWHMERSLVQTRWSGTPTH
jgi:hypothetical protein